MSYCVCVGNYCNFVNFPFVSEIPALQVLFITEGRHLVKLITACDYISGIIITDYFLISVKSENLYFPGCSHATLLYIVTGDGV